MLPTLAESMSLLEARAVSAVELVQRCLEQVASRDGELHGFVTLGRQGALAQAARADAERAAGRAGPLCGAPLTIKDIIDVAGLPTGCGAPGPHLQAPRDATVVRRLRAAGAVILGKVQLHERALGITGENPRLGTPRNPHAPDRLAGGSSSGSAVSVAAHMALGSVGTDTGGSIRVPAALCSLVGFKPTFGRIGRTGVHPLSWTMDHVGLLGRTVDDVALLWQVVQGGDEQDLHSDRPGVAASLSPAAAAGAPVRVAVLEQLLAGATREVRSAVQRGLDRLRAQGVALEPVALPMARQVGAIHRTVLLAEAAAVHRAALSQPGAEQHFGADVLALLRQGLALGASELALALERRLRFRAACLELLADHTALCCPTTWCTAPRVGQEQVSLPQGQVPLRTALITCTCPFSLVGLPAITVPCGEDTDGLPVGLQLVGGPRRDEQLLRLAGAAVAIDPQGAIP